MTKGSRWVGGLTLGLTLLSGIATAEAGRRHGCVDCVDHAPCAECEKTPCQPQMVEKTIMVPQMRMEKRKVCTVEYRCEPRKEVVTVCRLVPEVTRTKKLVTDMVPVARTRVEKCLVRKPVTRVEECEVQVMTPYREKREGTRFVTRCVTEKVKQKVCEDQGHYEDQVIETPICATDDECQACGRRGWRRRGCSVCSDVSCTLIADEKQAPSEKQAPQSCKTTVRVWVPKMVEKEIEVEVKRPECVEEKFVYFETVCRPEMRKVKRCYTDWVEEPGERRVTYYECVPKQREVVCCNVSYKKVTENREITRMIRIPQEVEKEISVPVCTMVEKKVLCPVYPPCPSCKTCR